MDLSYVFKNSHAAYSIHPKYYPSIDVSPTGVDFDFRKSIDLGGHVFLVQYLEKIGKNEKN